MFVNTKLVSKKVLLNTNLKIQHHNLAISCFILFFCNVEQLNRTVMNRALKVIVALMLMMVVSSSFVWKVAANNGKRPLTGTLNGHKWVDLGLPSGVLWATCNIGASDSLEKGDYFAWGEVEPKEDYLWETYKWSNDRDKLTKYCNNPRYGYKSFVDSITAIEPCDDAATVNWGAGWRTPTVEDFEELLDVCKWDWKEEFIDQPNGLPLVMNGGYLVTGPNGNSIFLRPTGFKCPGIQDSHIGYYWTKTLRSDWYPYSLTFTRQGHSYNHIYYWSSRIYGIPIRPVCSAK